MGSEVSGQTYQVVAHFKALNKGVFIAALKTFEKCFGVSMTGPLPGCVLLKSIGTDKSVGTVKIISESVKLISTA